MAAPSWLNVGTRANSSGATSRNPALPASRSNGNILIAVVASKNNATHSISGSGWASLTTQTNSGTGWTVSLWWRIVDGTEAAPTISWTGSVACFGQIIQYSRSPNLDTTNPFGTIGTPGTGTGATHTSTGFNSTQDNSLIIYIDAAAANTAIAQPTNWLERYDAGSATGATRNAGGDRTLATSGSASGNISVTGANAAWVQWQIEIREPLANVSVTGETLTATPSLIDGSVAIGADVSGETLSVTVSLIDGDVTTEDGGLTGTAADELLTEDGGFLLQEDGSYIQLGGGLTGTAADELLNEDGTFLLQEDGSYIQLDAATGDVSLSGETLVVTVTLVDGGVTGTASVTGETLSVTPTLTDGTVAAAANVTGETLTATPSLTDGAVTGTAAVTGETLTASPTLTDGAVTGTAEVSGETLSVTVTLIDGSVQTDGNASINGEVLTATPVLVEGAATGTASVAGEVLSVSPALIDGTVSTDGSVTVDGEVLAVSLVLIGGVVSIIGEPGTERPPKPPGGDDAPGHVGIAPRLVKDKYDKRGIDRDDLVAIYEQVVEGRGPKKVIAAVRKAIKPHVPEGEPSLPEPEVLDWSAIERDLRVRVALQRMQRALEDEEDAITVLLLGAA